MINFVSVSDDDEEEEETTSSAKPTGSDKTKPCTLEPAVKELMELIFDDDMFANTMMSMNLGNIRFYTISRQQIKAWA